MTTGIWEWITKEEPAEGVKGGAGSGNYGHSGRPGMVGGSGGRGRAVSAVAAITSKEKEAIRSYTWLEAQTINSELREGNVSDSGMFGTGRSRQDTVNLMDSAIDKAQPTARDMTLYSKFDAAHMLREGLLEPGKIVHNLAYTSVSERKGGVAASPTARYTVKAVLQLHIPKGSEGVLSIADVSQYPQEKEHLIHRGSRYTINSVTEPHNTYIDPYVIDATLLQASGGKS